MKTVRVLEDRNMDRLIGLSRTAAQRDKVTILIERQTPHRRIPVVEITPHGDIREVSPPTLRTSLRVLFEDQYLTAIGGEMNRVATAATLHFGTLVAETKRAGQQTAGRKGRKAA